jgi:hypothetical protein
MATHRVPTLLGPGQRVRLPSPFHAAMPLLALAALALALDAAPSLPWEAGVAAAALFFVAAAVRMAREYLDLRRLRATADRLILRGERMPDSPLLNWRAGELTGTGHRLALAASVRRLVRESAATTLPGAVPVNRVAVRSQGDALAALADRLDGPAPVAAQGVLQLELLLRDPDGPVYRRDRANELGPALDRALASLDNITWRAHR